MGDRWRTGNKVGRTIYRVTDQYPDGELIGIMDTPELARKVVDAVNLVGVNLPGQECGDGDG